jgi:hypothetical protein
VGISRHYERDYNCPLNTDIVWRCGKRDNKSTASGWMIDDEVFEEDALEVEKTSLSLRGFGDLTH